MRPTIDETMLKICNALALRAACAKRQVGCVLVSKDGCIIGTGYNGKARGLTNCSPVHPCRGGCEGVHAEINALAQATTRDLRIAYVSTFPCWHCVKSLINTNCQLIVTPATDDLDLDQKRALALWRASGRQASKGDEHGI
jgi:deoxycytidylate deaminase